MKVGPVCRESRSLPPVADVSRRALLGGIAAARLSVATGVDARCASAFKPAAPLFTIGAASGDPTHNSEVLWTRFAPDPFHGGGLRPEPVAVGGAVATYGHIHHVFCRGTIADQAAIEQRCAITSFSPRRLHLGPPRRLARLAGGRTMRVTLEKFSCRQK
jgi:phosphodiesterase/alkaline phosphatase D-like protein